MSRIVLTAKSGKGNSRFNGTDLGKCTTCFGHGETSGGTNYRIGHMRTMASMKLTK